MLGKRGVTLSFEWLALIILVLIITILAIFFIDSMSKRSDVGVNATKSISGSSIFDGIISAIFGEEKVSVGIAVVEKEMKADSLYPISVDIPSKYISDNAEKPVFFQIVGVWQIYKPFHVCIECTDTSGCQSKGLIEETGCTESELWQDDCSNYKNAELCSPGGTSLTCGENALFASDSKIRILHDCKEAGGSSGAWKVTPLMFEVYDVIGAASTLKERVDSTYLNNLKSQNSDFPLQIIEVSKENEGNKIFLSSEKSKIDLNIKILSSKGEYGPITNGAVLIYYVFGQCDNTDCATYTKIGMNGDQRVIWLEGVFGKGLPYIANINDISSADCEKYRTGYKVGTVCFSKYIDPSKYNGNQINIAETTKLDEQSCKRVIEHIPDPDSCKELTN